MKHLITDIAVTFPAQGEPVIELFTGKHSIGTVNFEPQPPIRARVPQEETEPFSLHFPTAMRDLVLGLLQRGDGIEFDRERGELSVGSARTGRG